MEAVERDDVISVRMNADPPALVCLLGPPKVVGLEIDRTFPQKGYQLLALVARARDHQITRREAAGLLWDNISEDKSLNNLRQLIRRVRKAQQGIGILIEADLHNIRLGPDKFKIDLHQMTNGQPSSIIEFYKGDLLTGVRDTTELYQDWLRFERTLLRERFFSATTETLMEMTRFGRANKAEIDTLATRMLAVEQDREESYRTLIDAYGRAGYFEEAARRYHNLVEMLRTVYGTEPLAETKAVVRRVLSGRHAIQGIDPVLRITPPVSPPRVAFLTPRWLGADEGAQGFLKAFIEDVANELARYRTFVMLAPHSSFQIAHDSGMPSDNTLLRADYTVSGLLKPNGVLSLRMVSSSEQEIVWAGDFKTSIQHIVGCFGQLTTMIASTVADGIEKEFARNIRSTTNYSAYSNYLNGQRFMQDCTLSNLRRARKSFRATATEDSTFAPAHARIAQTLYQEWLMTGAEDPLVLREARASADYAVDVDANCGVAQWMSGVISLYQRDFSSCEHHFAAAEILSPNAPDLMVQYGDALSHLGEPNKGMERFQTALDLNPLPPEHYWWVGASIAFNQRDYQRAIDYCHKIDNDESVVRILTSAHALNGDTDEARSYAHRLRELYPNITAANLIKLPPDRNDENVKIFVEGLRMAGIR
ncbi:BTAD domain-containing putative transcriptional regulator [Mesorhizobium sp. M0058]|uniref:BTAD domain-containing putative transcriptional regulator n=1 Tax=Mesorhizobium sp. M0058 TaxID=2956865 RepID=UPI00333BB78C